MLLSTLIIHSCNTALHSYPVILMIQQIKKLSNKDFKLHSHFKTRTSSNVHGKIFSFTTQFFSHNYHINMLTYIAVCIMLPNKILQFARFALLFPRFSFFPPNRHTHICTLMYN